VSLAEPLRSPATRPWGALLHRLHRVACERCGRRLTAGDEATVCEHGCAFCAPCTEELGGHCLNCPGELVARPRRG
jgi:hypothetical protein